MCEAGRDERHDESALGREGLTPVSRDPARDSFLKHLAQAVERGISDTVTLRVFNAETGQQEIRGMARMVRTDLLEGLQRNQAPVIFPLTDFQKRFVHDLVGAALKTANRTSEVCFRCNPWEWKLYKEWLDGEEWFLSYELKPDPDVPIGKFEVGDWL